MSRFVAKWKRLASTDRLRRSSQTVSVIGDNAYVFGGELLPRQPVDDQLDVVEISHGAKSASTQTVRPSGYVPTPRVGSATAVLNNTLYLFSGRGGVAMAPIDERGCLWKFTPSTSQWSSISPASTTTPVPAARSYHAMTSDKARKLYVHAGCPEKGRLSDLWSFDTESRVWRQLADAPAPPRGGTSIAYAAGKLYRMNGFDGVREQGGKLDVYDVQKDEWSTIEYEADGESGPEARSVSALLELRVGGKEVLVTLFGEHDPSELGHAGAGKMLEDAWVFDLGAEKWSLLSMGEERPQARGWFGAGVVRDGRGSDGILVHGGLAEDNSRLGDVWMAELETVES